MTRNVFQVVSALQSIVFKLFFWADQVSCKSYVGSAYRMRSLAVSHSFAGNAFFNTAFLSFFSDDVKLFPFIFGTSLLSNIEASLPFWRVQTN